jgi:hypothetical protein
MSARTPLAEGQPKYALLLAGVQIHSRHPGTSPQDVRSWDMADPANDVRSRGDSVAIVVLPKVSKILRAAGAIFV